ncbi:MAG: asparagine synthase C-terminal domain-containing protein, partial [Candidatus Bathyarchaeia archaeon]
MNLDIIEHLRQKLILMVNRITANEVGVAFSGGVDSSLLAKLCKDVGKEVKLLTIGFVDRKDIEISTKTANMMGLNFFNELVPLKELENGLKTVLAKIEFDRMVRFENCVCFYYVFRLAAKQGLRIVLSANGLDELFCGYTIYKTRYDDEALMESLMKTLVDVARKDSIEIKKIAQLFDINYTCPFLSEEFADFAMQIPICYKIKDPNDNIRKHILRNVALRIGVPRQAALKPKKAFQYSSGIHKAIRQLAKKNGFTKNRAT